MKYFKNILNYENLKAQYKELLKANHPDNGGNVEVMKEINVEYDSLFPIWKNRKETETGCKVNETVDSTRSEFYTQFGWKGSNHDWNRLLKEVAQIVRSYVKEKYPTYKFSVRTSYASMCQELHVELKESPIEIYKPFNELTDEDFQEIGKRLHFNIYKRIDFLNLSREEKLKEIEESQNAYVCVLNETTEKIIKDVDDFVNSYNFHDCDGMIDYFHVDFYYLGCLRNNGADVKIVPKKAKKAKSKKKTSVSKEQTGSRTETNERSISIKYTYKVTHGEDTRDGSSLWLVRIQEKLDKKAYIEENKRISKLGGYYSKFRKAFIFRENPEPLLGIV